MTTENTCFFTGHRDIPDDRYEDIYDAVYDSILALYKKGYRNFISGGAVGFDLMAAAAVLEMKNIKGLDIKLHMMLPCADQDKYFSHEEKDCYRDTIGLADTVEVLYPHYVRGCMHARNRKMVDASSAGIVYCIRESGGTAYTVNYAKKKFIDLIFLK